MDIFTERTCCYSCTSTFLVLAQQLYFTSMCMILWWYERDSNQCSYTIHFTSGLICSYMTCTHIITIHIKNLQTLPGLAVNWVQVQPEQKIRLFTCSPIRNQIDRFIRWHRPEIGLNTIVLVWDMCKHRKQTPIGEKQSLCADKKTIGLINLPKSFDEAQMWIRSQRYFISWAKHTPLLYEY
mgnify:CR=1 FL=1